MVIRRIVTDQHEWEQVFVLRISAVARTAKKIRNPTSMSSLCRKIGPIDRAGKYIHGINGLARVPNTDVCKRLFSNMHGNRVIPP